MKVFNVNIPPITKKQAFDVINCNAKKNEKTLIFTPNPEILLEARINKKLENALNSADILLPDGHGLLFVSKLSQMHYVLRFLAFVPLYFLFLFNKKYFKSHFTELTHGVDFMDDLMCWCGSNDKSVFLLGGAGDVAQKTSEYFLQKYPKIKNIFFSNLDPGKESFDKVFESNADVLLVAYGAPKQELWLTEYFAKLPNTKLAIGVGGSFDFWSGKVKRAPKFMQQLGLEWLFRLILSPKSRLKRIINALIVFPVIFLFSSSSLKNEPTPDKAKQIL